MKIPRRFVKILNDSLEIANSEVSITGIAFDDISDDNFTYWITGSKDSWSYREFIADTKRVIMGFENAYLNGDFK